MNISEFILKDVRCFAGEQRIRIAPLTFLIGENSTGKSTVLGCLNALLSETGVMSENYSFNQPPYELGTFSEIVRISKESFELGYTHKPRIFKSSIISHITFEHVDNKTAATKARYVLPNGEIVVIRTPEQSNDSKEHRLPFSIRKERKRFTIEYRGSVEREMDFSDVLQFIDRRYYTLDHELEQKPDEIRQNTISQLREFYIENLTDYAKQRGAFAMRMRWHRMNIYDEMISVSPIRSQPKRTYDPIRSTETPEGDDVPIYLMRLKRQGDTHNIFKSLQKFGRASGLFTAIDVKTFSENMSDPFQIQVKVRGVQSNLSDVGYGISQLLPILVRIFADTRHSTMLLQQPEVHLHPRAQAELSSLFISAIKQNRQSFVIETHSDAMIDRARIEIMRGKIKPEDVSLVYFEPKGKSVQIHNIGCDEDGNLLNVPQGYRDFFMTESDRLLGFID